MKKLKWILLFIMVLLAVLFLFATCRKTKALESVYNNTNIHLDCLDSNSGIVMIYKPSDISTGTDNFRINYTDGNTSNYFVMSSFSNRLSIYFGGGIGTIDNLAFQVNYTDISYYYAVIGCTYDTEYIFDMIIGYCSFNATTSSFTYYEKQIDFSLLQQEQSVLNSAYYTNDVTVYPAYYFASANYKGCFNAFIYDIYDYSFPTAAFSEYYNDLKEDIIKPNITATTEYYNYNAGYQAGYNAGYQLGYDDGYTAGQTAGYNSGYQAGYNDGLADNTTAYNHGYADGYRNGYDLGMTDGDEIGYQRGLAEGLAGATPVSQTVTLLGSIFGSIGTVLSIQLFPGFTLGLLILVPLFFAVLGLILWIWRRN